MDRENPLTGGHPERIEDAVSPRMPTTLRMGSRGIRSSAALLLVVAAVGVGAGLVGWWVGSRVKSPEQIAAETAPPPPSLVTAAVEFRQLSEVVVLRGILRPPEVMEVNPGLFAGGSSVVSRSMINAGDVVDEGAALFEVSGRPVFVIAGAVPVYRDLVFGAEGDDVAQVQEALSRLGLFDGEVDGRFGETTQAAIGELYGQAGYDPAVAGDEATLAASEYQVDAARRTVRDSQSALAAARRVSGLAVTQAEAELAAARRSVTASETKAGLDRVEADAGLDAARNALEEVAGHPDATPAEVEAAHLAVLAAQNDLIRVELDGQEAIAAAVDRVRVAEAGLADAQRAPDTAGASDSLADARADLARAEADHRALIDASGVMFRSSELVVLSSLPARVTTTDLVLGSTPGSPAAVLVSGNPVADALLTGAERSLINEGDTVVIESTAAGIHSTGQVAGIADQTTTDAAGLTGFVAVIRPEAALGPETAGAEVQLSISATITDDAVLVVPVTAVTTGAGGDAQVTVVGRDGETWDVAVGIGASVGGFVEVIPAGNDLRSGMRVRVATG